MSWSSNHWHFVAAARVGALVLAALMLPGSHRTARAADDDKSKAEAKSDSTKENKSDEEKESDKPSKFKKFSEVTEDAKKIEGLFDLYRKDDTLYAALKPGDFDELFLTPISVARGVAAAGLALNFDEQWIISFERVGNTVHVVRKNLRYEAPAGSPLAKAVSQNYADSVLISLPIISDDAPGGAVLVDFGDVFLTNFANLPVGDLDRKRSSWKEVKGFPENIEIEVELTFGSNPVPNSMGVNGDLGYIDRRGVTVVLHYGIVKMPKLGYQPRLADQRIGHFLNATKNFGSLDPDTTFVRRINRWRLEKAEPDAKLSVPKRQIVWWIEDTVPYKYRPYVEEGILEWNKAFEKIGFKSAISVRWQNEHDDFAPEDVNYCTFRWVTTPMTFAMSNVRSNPLTGEMIDGDVIFDASWIRVWKQEHAFLVGATSKGDPEDTEILDVGEIISPMMAAQYGYGLPMALRVQSRSASADAVLRGDRLVDVIPGNWNPIHVALSRQASSNGNAAVCQYASSIQGQLRMAAMSLVARGDDEGEDMDSAANLPEKLVGQVIKGVVMHEVGHSLGLRHNFRGSAMLDFDQLNDTHVTHKRGLSGSVMDYNPVNLARQGEKQGDYATTTLGPYDYWAIEYAYKPIAGDEQAERTELKKIASRSAEHDLDYATDDDLYVSYDPSVNQYDLGADSLKFAANRVGLAEELLADMEDKLVKDGDSWARLRPAFLTVLQQYGDATFLAARHIGGRHVTRDVRGSKDAHDPLTPVAGDEQRAALKFITEKILVDQPLPVRPELLRHVTSEHWSHWGSDNSIYEGKVGVPYFSAIQSMQNIALSEIFGSGVRFRLIESNEALAEPGDNPLHAAEVFRTYTDAVWSPVKGAVEGKANQLALSKVRRNLQRLHLRYLVRIALGPKDEFQVATAYAMFNGVGQSFPQEARSLARQHLKEIDQLLKSALDKDELTIDDLTRAHLEELRDQLEKALDAQVEAGDF